MTHGIFDVVRHKVPLLSLFVQMLIVNVFYRECVSDEGHMIGFWIYFPTLSLICFVWELTYAFRLFSQIYQDKTLRSRIGFALISTMTSTLIFCTTSYYVEAGRPFSCIYPYNQIAATTLFYVTISLLILLSLYEHYRWGIIGSLLPMTIHDRIHDDSTIRSGNFTEIPRLSVTNLFSNNKKIHDHVSQEKLLQHNCGLN